MDDEHSKKKLIEIRDIYSGDNLRLLPLLSYKKLNDLYNASDYSIWFDASITIQESMGTGLKIIIPNSKRVNHLVDDENGYFFDDILDIPKLITDVPKDYNRDELVKNNLKYSYDSIVLNIIDQLNFG